MLQALLAERFQLELRKEMRPLPAFALTAAKGGVKMERVAEPTGAITVGNTRLGARGVPMSKIAELIADKAGRPVIDRTGDVGMFNFRAHFAADNAPPESTEPAFSTALEEQCGLKLQAITARQEVYLIERAEKPSGN